jgi:hypothetical protein
MSLWKSTLTIRLNKLWVYYYLYKFIAFLLVISKICVFYFSINDLRLISIKIYGWGSWSARIEVFLFNLLNCNILSIWDSFSQIIKHNEGLKPIVTHKFHTAIG